MAVLLGIGFLAGGITAVSPCILLSALGLPQVLLRFVLGGTGTVHALFDGRPARAFRVDVDRLYSVLSRTASRDGVLELRFSPGVTAYAFTFG